MSGMVPFDWADPLDLESELTDEELSLESVNGHLLAMIAAGVCDADCYYRGPYENGAAFFLLEVPELRERQSPPSRIINVFMQFISTFEVNHRRAMLAYLQARGYSCAAEGETLVGSGPLGSVACRFDAHDRFVEATAKMGADALRG